MKYDNIEYKKGRIIKATYLYTNKNIDQIVTKKLLVLEDVFEGDKDIKCLDISLYKSEFKQNIIIIPNIKENIIELPSIMNESNLNYINYLIKQINSTYIYALDPNLK